eukprot:UN13204
MPEDARGCEDKWACCEQAPEEKGCQTVCDRCSVRWGHKPGCSWPELDDENKEYFDEEYDDDMKTNDYDEAHNPTILNDLAEERQQELTPAPPMGGIPTTSQRAISTDELL